MDLLLIPFYIILFGIVISPFLYIRFGIHTKVFESEKSELI
ncbi:zinc ribbon domain-containing protein, partial [Leptospira santarosai]